MFSTSDFFENVSGGGGPHERFGLGIVGFEVVHDGLLQFGDASEDAASDALVGDLGKEALDLIEPRGGCGRKVEMNARMLGQPSLHGLGLVGGVIVHDQMKIEMPGCVALNDPEEAQELLGPMPRQALADHLAGLHIQGGEQGRGAMALVVVRPG